jgi:Protein of unknown function (DUF2281)
MSTISAIFEPAADGTLHLPVPAAWRKLSIRVKAELEPVAQPAKPAAEGGLKGFGCLRGKISMAADFDQPLEDFKDYMA